MSCLYEIPDLLQARELREIARQLADAPWQDGRASAGGQAAQV